MLLLLGRPVELHRVNEGRPGAVDEEGIVRAGGRVFARFLQCGVVVVVWKQSMVLGRICVLTRAVVKARAERLVSCLVEVKRVRDG